jgi:hypothetical protein
MEINNTKIKINIKFVYKIYIYKYTKKFLILIFWHKR